MFDSFPAQWFGQWANNFNSSEMWSVLVTAELDSEQVMIQFEQVKIGPIPLAKDFFFNFKSLM